MSDSFGERFYHLLNDLEDWVARGYRVEHPPYEPISEHAVSPGPSAPESLVSKRAASAPRRLETKQPTAEAGGEELSREERLARVAELVISCTKCPLHQGRTRAVPGYGVLDPLLMVIGEGPGAEEDRQGLPFVGPAGQYLDKWLSAIGIYRDRNAYIANIVKCRPPNNRDPKQEEADACMPYLREQIDLVRPKAILTVGRVALRFLTGETEGIGRVHGRLYEYRGVPLMPTYHPSGVLRNPEYRRPVWEDLKKLRDEVLQNGG